jgi:hypothetical protein
MNASSRMTFNRRRAQRAAVSLPATVVTMSAYQYLDVLDLSATGGKLRGESLPELGKTALFRLNGYETLCKVVWVDGDTCGVKFEDVLAPRILKHFHDVGQQASLHVVAPPRP